MANFSPGGQCQGGGGETLQQQILTLVKDEMLEIPRGLITAREVIHILFQEVTRMTIRRRRISK